jgi:hypothetical protein
MDTLVWNIVGGLIVAAILVFLGWSGRQLKRYLDDRRRSQAEKLAADQALAQEVAQLRTAVDELRREQGQWIASARMGREVFREVVMGIYEDLNALSETVHAGMAEYTLPGHHPPQWAPSETVLRELGLPSVRPQPARVGAPVPIPNAADTEWSNARLFAQAAAVREGRMTVPPNASDAPRGQLKAPTQWDILDHPFGNPLLGE